MLCLEDWPASKSVEPVGETIDTTNSGKTGREGDNLSSQG